METQCVKMAAKLSSIGFLGSGRMAMAMARGFISAGEYINIVNNFKREETEFLVIANKLFYCVIMHNYVHIYYYDDTYTQTVENLIIIICIITQLNSWLAIIIGDCTVIYTYLT